MVLLKRRMRTRTENSSSVPYGDGRNSPTCSDAPSFLSLNISGKNVSNFSFDYDSRNRTSRWIFTAKVTYLCFSWVIAFWFLRKSNEIVVNLEDQRLGLQIQQEQMSNTFDDATQSLIDLGTYQETLEQAQEALLHEVRIINEMYEAEPGGKGLPEAPPQNSSQTIIKKWLNHREEILVEKINNLKEFIQKESRQFVLDRWGPGPHRVKFTVNFSQQAIQRDFTVQLAPVDLLPHSVNLSLRMVELRVWDNTVFWHHNEVKHVMAAALFSHSTGESRFHHLNALGVRNLSFGEYSSKYPHEKYTIGFSGLGPNIYVNLMNNENHHGPDKQPHHEIPNEGEPCFAKIIENQSLIDDLYRLSRNEKSVERKDARVGWHEKELTHILKVELLENDNSN